MCMVTLGQFVQCQIKATGVKENLSGLTWVNAFK